MARRRVFKVRFRCPQAVAETFPVSAAFYLIGKTATLEQTAESDIAITLAGLALGKLDVSVSTQVVAAMARGQVFSAIVINGFPAYTQDLKPDGADIDIKVEYMLDAGNPAIEIDSAWRAVHVDSSPPRASHSFFTKVAGVTHEGRQRIITRCIIGESLTLVRDPHNRYDRGAIKVLRANGEQLGFIPAHVSRGAGQSGLSEYMDRGARYSCRISDLTGGGDLSLGVNIEVTEGEFIEPLPLPAPPTFFRSATVPESPSLLAVFLGILTILGIFWIIAVALRP